MNKKDFLEGLTEEELNAGYIKFNIPGEENIYSKNGEGVWGWLSPEDKVKYDDDSYNGKVNAILCNCPLNYFGKLRWADEVVLQCNGSFRPSLCPEWIKRNLL